MLLERPPDRPKPARREKRNKYAQFSKAAEVQKSLRFSNVEPPEDAKDGSSETSDDGSTGYALRVRDEWSYPDAAEVDQRDPTTFGFSEVGVVLGAHGTRGEIRVKSDSDFAAERLCKPGKLWLRKPRRRAPREHGLVAGRKGPGNGVWLVLLEGVDTRDGAAVLRGASLHVRREVQPTLAPDEILLWQLEGLTVARAIRCLDNAQASTDGANGAEWAQEVGEILGKIVGVIPREEITGDPELGHDLLEIEKVVPQCEALSTESAVFDQAERCKSASRAEEESDEDLENVWKEPDTVFVPYVEQIVVDVRLDDGLILVDPPEGLFDLIQPKKVTRVVIRGLLPQFAESLRRGNDT